MAIVDSDAVPPGKKEGDDADTTTGEVIKVGDKDGKYQTETVDTELLKEAKKVAPMGGPPLEKILPSLVTKEVETPKSLSKPDKTKIQKVVNLPGAALLLVLAVFLGIAFVLGHLTAGTKEIPAPVVDSGPGNSDYHTDDGDYEPGSEGLVGTTWALDAISKANSSIVWITNFPNVARIPEALRQRQNAGISVLIIVGSTCNLENAKDPLRLNLSVYKSPLRVENPQSLIFIDRHLLVDAARQQTAWRTTDPAIIKEFGSWINRKILPDCLPLHIEADPNLHP